MCEDTAESANNRKRCDCFCGFGEKVGPSSHDLIHTVWQNMTSSWSVPSPPWSRVNFTLDDLDAVSPAYDHFVACVTECSDQYGLKGACLDSPIPQYFQYQRVPQLVSVHAPLAHCTCVVRLPCAICLVYVSQVVWMLSLMK